MRIRPIDIVALGVQYIEPGDWVFPKASDMLAENNDQVEGLAPMIVTGSERVKKDLFVGEAVDLTLLNGQTFTVPINTLVVVKY